MGRLLNNRGFGQWFAQIAGDIFKFCQALNFTPTWQQAQLLEAVQRGDRRIAVRAGKGPGKSASAAVVSLWRSMREPGALTVVTAPTMRQCTEILMGEVRGHTQRADPVIRKIFKVTNTRVVIGGEKDWGIKLVTASKEENAQGYHDPNMTVIAEEASGIDREIITAFKGTLSNPNSLFVQIGNPNTRDCAFFDCFHSQKDEWTKLRWNAEETPESPWFSHERNREVEREFGRDSDTYRIAVLGEFPHTDPQCVIATEDLEKVTADTKQMVAMARIPRGEGLPPARQFGLDYARFGGDENTIFRRSGNSIVEWGFWPHTDPNDINDTAFRMQRNAGWRDSETWYVADAGGMGQGVMRTFYNHGKQVLEFQNQSVAVRGKEYENRITEAWFHLSKLVRAGVCYLPLDNRLVHQLTTRRYFTTRKGKLILESKDEYMKRGNNSPDRADGCVLSFYDQVVAATRMSNVGPAGRQVGVRVN